jgi:hypothetical protein
MTKIVDVQFLLEAAREVLEGDDMTDTESYIYLELGVLMEEIQILNTAPMFRLTDTLKIQ